MRDTPNDNLMRKLGLNALTSDDQRQALDAIGRMVYQAVFLRVLEELDDEKRREFEAVLARAESAEEILEFLDRNVLGFERIVKEEAEKFRTESLEFMQRLG